MKTIVTLTSTSNNSYQPRAEDSLWIVCQISFSTDNLKGIFAEGPFFNV